MRLRPGLNGRLSLGCSGVTKNASKRFFELERGGVFGASSLTCLGGLGDRTGDPDLLDDICGSKSRVRDSIGDSG